MGWVPPQAPPDDAPSWVHEAHRRALVGAMWPSTRGRYERARENRLTRASEAVEPHDAGRYAVVSFTLSGGPWSGYTFGGCPNRHCDTCAGPPDVLEWDTPKGRYRYVLQDGATSSTDGPFDHMRRTYRWEPE